ncbi:PfkB family carbohydrate kinase [Candidatus Riflebacteria bacterium]
MSILVVGSIAYDTIKTPVKKVERALGGSAVYFSTVASFFTKVRMVGVAGADFADADMDWLKSRNIDTSGLQITSGKTFHWDGEYSAALADAQTHNTELNVFENFDPKLEGEMKSPDILFLANIDPTLQINVIKQVEKPKLIVLDTMNLWIDNKLTELKKAFSMVDVLIINETEARMLTGEKKVIACGEKLFEFGPKKIVIKLGEYGATYFGKGPDGISYFFGPAYPTKKIIDPTGAGDSFAGGFVGYLGTCDTLDDEAFCLAVVYGGVTASLTVEDFSIDRYRGLKADELQKRFETCYDMTNFSLERGRKVDFKD